MRRWARLGRPRARPGRRGGGRQAGRPSSSAPRRRRSRRSWSRAGAGRRAGGRGGRRRRGRSRSWRIPRGRGGHERVAVEELCERDGDLGRRRGVGGHVARSHPDRHANLTPPVAPHGGTPPDAHRGDRARPRSAGRRVGRPAMDDDLAVRLRRAGDRVACLHARRPGAGGGTGRAVAPMSRGEALARIGRTEGGFATSIVARRSARPESLGSARRSHARLALGDRQEVCAAFEAALAPDRASNRAAPRGGPRRRAPNEGRADPRDRPGDRRGPAGPAPSGPGGATAGRAWR